MAKYASEMLKQAKAWIGKKESDGSHKEIIDTYNSHKPLARGYKVKYTDSWCATFVSAVAIKLGYTDIIPIECSCGQMIKLAQSKGIWVENENRVPNAGDLILYDWDDTKGSATDDKGWPEHVGIVESVSKGVITVIEGNYSNAVKRRTVNVNGKFIRGYITPKYDVKPATTQTTTQTTTTVSKYYTRYVGNSYKVDQVLAAINVPAAYRGSWKKRAAIASANGINNYTGTAAQNTKIIALAKEGKLKKV